NRAYGINTTIPELKEADFGEIAESIHRECILYPVPKIMDDKDIFRLLGMLKGSSGPGSNATMENQAAKG
ncbi:MAG: hypothetical protein PHH96_11060, partial [Smithellaceae bacterium]|nr:hypothetical protein [Smithellaceae bacterium]